MANKRKTSKAAQKPVETYTLTVKDKSCVLAKPDKATISEAFSLMTPMDEKIKPDVVGAGIIFIEKGWISGDEEIKTNSRLMTSAAMAAVQLFEMKDAEMIELENDQFEITVEGKKALINYPDRKTYAQAMALLMPSKNSRPDLIAAGEWILKLGWIEGDDEIRNDEDLLIAAALKASELIEPFESELKKN